MSAWSASNGPKAGKAPKGGSKEDDVDSYFKIHEVRRVVNVAVNNVAADRPADFRAALCAELRKPDILSAAKPGGTVTKEDTEKAKEYLQQHQAEELLGEVLSKLAAAMPANASAELADLVASAPPPKPKKEAPKKESAPKKEKKDAAPPKKAEAPKADEGEDVKVDDAEADDFFAAFAGGADKVVLPEKKEEKKAEEKKDEGDKKQDAAPAAPKKDEGPPAGVDPKKWKAAVKEGGKKGVELAGCADMGGLEFFTTQIEAAEGDIQLIQGAMDAANKEVDPKDEEAKGGSALVGKMLLSSGTGQLGLVCYVPKEKGDKADATEWMKAVLASCGGELLEGDALTAKGVVKGDGETRFPLKDKDSCQAASVEWLKGKGLFPQADEEADDWVCEDDTIEW